MNGSPEPAAPLWPLAVYFALALALAAVMELASYLFGQGPRPQPKAEPYESGIVSTGSARLRLPIRFYLVAMFFVIFDLEAVFLFTWALVLTEAGWPGYLEMLVFVGILALALAYLWRQGALDWTAVRPRWERGRT